MAMAAAVTHELNSLERAKKREYNCKRNCISEAFAAKSRKRSPTGQQHSHFDSDKFRLLLLNMVVYANRLTKTKAPLGDLERATVVPLEKRRLGGSQTGAASAPRCTTSCNFTF